jgi:hypothetical protein
LPAFDALWRIRADDYVKRDVRHSDYVVVTVDKTHIYTSNLEREKNNPYSVWVMVRDEETRFMDIPIEQFATLNRIIQDLSIMSGLRLHLETVLDDPVWFYETHACPAEFNPRGYFNLIDGHHRCVHLLKCGFNGLPLRVRKSEWKAYFREAQAQALMDRCKEMDALPFAIKHPSFAALPVSERPADAEFMKLYHNLTSWGGVTR